MVDQKTKDLFKETTMTFGEHLEELRTCLFKALIGLVVGFVIGLFIAKYVVQFIQLPLEQALTSYRERQTISRLEQLQADGALPPGDLAQYADLVKKDHLLAKEYYVDPAELRHIQPEQPKPADNRTDNRTNDSVDDGAVTAPPEVHLIRKDNLVPMTLWYPVREDVKVTSLNAHEAFVIWIKAALVAGVLIASPYIFYQIWSFVAAGLYPHEKHYVHVFLPFSLGLFLAGASVAFFLVFKPVLQFLLTFNEVLGIDPDLRISEWLSFVLILPLGFGISFQLPLVMLFLERIGIFDVQAYLSKWRVAILVIFVLAMFLTPADPTSMILMAIPLTVLYFGGILLCKYMPRKQSPYDEWDEES